MKDIFLHEELKKCIKWQSDAVEIFQRVINGLSNPKTEK